MHDRERQGFADRIEDMKLEAERRNSEHMAALTDQRPQTEDRKGFWARLLGYGVTKGTVLVNLTRSQNDAASAGRFFEL